MINKEFYFKIQTQAKKEKKNNTRWNGIQATYNSRWIANLNLEMMISAISQAAARTQIPLNPLFSHHPATCKLMQTKTKN